MNSSYTKVKNHPFVNDISPVLDEFSNRMAKLHRIAVRAILCVDQSAKIISISSFFPRSLDYWNVAISASVVFHALTSVGPFIDGRGLLKNEATYANRLFFVECVGSIFVNKKLGQQPAIFAAVADSIGATRGAFAATFNGSYVQALFKKLQDSASAISRIEQTEEEYKNDILAAKLFTSGLKII